MSALVLRCYVSDYDTFSAYNAEDVAAIRTELGQSFDGAAPAAVAIPGDTMVTIDMPDRGPVTRLAREWAADGRGLLCSEAT